MPDTAWAVAGQELRQKQQIRATLLRDIEARDAEIAHLRAGIAGLRREHLKPCHKAIQWEHHAGPLRCTCGADAHNARVAALLGETDG